MRKQNLGPVHRLNQGSPTPGLWTSTGPWPVRNWAAQQEVSGRRANEASSAAPHGSPWLVLPPEPSIALLPEQYHPHPAPVCGNTVFHETSPWCQKGWGPLD